MHDDHFGTWILLPQHNHYAWGPPPRAGRYTIAPDGDGVRFAVAWIEWTGATRQVQFLLGAEGPMRLRWPDAATLDSEVWDGATLVQHARRSLSADGAHLLVSQSGRTPAGQPYCNLQTWRRGDRDEPLVPAPLRVAVAGPYSASTAAERQQHLATLESAAALVLARGHVPLLGVSAALPLLRAWPDPADAPNPSEKSDAIMAISLAIVRGADVLLQLGASPGADRERDLLVSLGRPVLTSIDELPA